MSQTTLKLRINLVKAIKLSLYFLVIAVIITITALLYLIFIYTSEDVELLYSSFILLILKPLNYYGKKS